MYNYSFNDYSGISSTGLLAGIGIYLGILSVLSILMIISNWKIYKKAGEHGWASIVPVYNIVVLLEICDLPLWYIVLFMIPIVNIYAIFKTYIELAHKFGKSTGFGVLTVFFSIICLPILAFGKSEYKKNDNNESSTNTSNNIENNSINQDTFNSQLDNNLNNQNVFNSVIDNNINNQNEFNSVVDNNVNSQNTFNSQLGNNENVNFNSIYQGIDNRGSSINSFVPVGDLNINNQNDLLNNQVSTKKCPNFGKELPMNVSFCDNCGQQL